MTDTCLVLWAHASFVGRCCSSVLFSSNEGHLEAEADSKFHQSFKTVNAAVVHKLSEELDSLPENSDGNICFLAVISPY